MFTGMMVGDVISSGNQIHQHKFKNKAFCIYSY